MRIAISSDHASFELKEHIKKYMSSLGHDVSDMGTDNAETGVDYPDFALKVCDAVNDGEARFGVLLCGTGLGMSISANKVNGIRAALCYMPECAKLARGHNDANVLVLGGRIMGPQLAEWTVDAFLNSEFEGGRHARRVDKIGEIEKKQLKDFD